MRLLAAIIGFHVALTDRIAFRCGPGFKVQPQRFAEVGNVIRRLHIVGRRSHQAFVDEFFASATRFQECRRYLEDMVHQYAVAAWAVWQFFSERRFRHLANIANRRLPDHIAARRQFGLCQFRANVFIDAQKFHNVTDILRENKLIALRNNWNRPRAKRLQCGQPVNIISNVYRFELNPTDREEFFNP